MPPVSYQRTTVCDRLARYIEAVWSIGNRGATERPFTLFPDGYFDLVLTVRNGELETAVLHGIYTRQQEVVLPPDADVIGITFPPLAAEYILSTPVAALVNGSTVLSLTDGWWAGLPLDRTLPQLVRVIESRVEVLQPVDGRKADLFALAFGRAGEITVRELSTSVFWSSRQINRYFKRWIGIPPKAYLNILRCSAAYPELSTGDTHPPAGFYDQSHFIKQMRKHTGFTTRELARNPNDRFLQLSRRYRS